MGAPGRLRCWRSRCSRSSARGESLARRWQRFASSARPLRQAARRPRRPGACSTSWNMRGASRLCARRTASEASASRRRAAREAPFRERGSGSVQITAEDLRALVGILRVLPDRTQAEMAAAAHLHPTTVGRYEHGETIPDRRTLEKLAAAVPLPMWAIDGLLLPVIAVTRGLREGTTGELSP